MRTIIFLMAILLLPILSFAPSPDSEIRITYVAQSGVFIQSNQKKIMIDALFKGDSRWHYPAPSSGLIDSMERGIAPYNDINIYFVTHAHVDHFHPHSLAKALWSNPKAVIVTTPKVRERLKARCTDYEQIKERIVSPQIEYGKCMDTVIQGIPVHIAHLKHANDKEWPEVVYSFLIELNGKKILHNAGSTGYFPSEYERIRYDSIGVDIAILYKDFLCDTGYKGKEVIDKYIKPRNMLIGHIDNKSENFMDSLKMMYIKTYPNMNVMKMTGEYWIY